MGKQTCVVLGCGQVRKPDGLSIFKFPTDRALAENWRQFSGLTPEEFSALTMASSGICERHFRKEYVNRGRFGARLLDPRNVPDLHGPPGVPMPPGISLEFYGSIVEDSSGGPPKGSAGAIASMPPIRPTPYFRAPKKHPQKMDVLKACLLTALIINAYTPQYLPGATYHRNMDIPPRERYLPTGEYDDDDEEEYPKPWVLVRKKGYGSLFDNAKRIPVYSRENLTPKSFDNTTGVKRKNRFTRSLDIGVLFQAAAESYSKSGFDQGHAAPYADMVWDQLAADESFCFVNIFPQHPKLNQIAWKNIEDRVRDLVKQGVKGTEKTFSVD